MAVCFENFRMREDRAIHAYYIVALMHHDAPPVVLQVALYFDTERSVIPSAIEPAVDFARLENKTAPLTQADDFFHALGVGWRAHRKCPQISQIYADLSRETVAGFR